MTETPRIPWWKPEFSDADLSSVAEAIRAQYINEGNLTERFESELCRITGAKFAVATTSGTSALFLALQACEIGPGDEVIVPDVTFAATANAVHWVGARPVFVDIDPKTLMMKSENISAAMTSKTKAVIPVHVTGRPAPVDEIEELCKEKNLRMIEDSAEGLFSRLKGKALGTFGDAGIFSFSPNKILTTGQGGMLVTSQAKIAEAARRLKDQGRPKRGTGGDDFHQSIGFNLKFTDLQAAVGLAQLQRVEKRVLSIRRRDQLYRDSLKDCEFVKFFEPIDGMLPLWTDILVEKRDSLVRFLLDSKIDCRKFWHPLHQHISYKLQDAAFPVASAMIPKALWLPSAFQLSEQEVLEVSSLVKKFFNA